MPTNIPPRPANSKLVHVVIDTPKGSACKYKWDEALGCFRLSRLLPAGAVFPWNFGYIPGTCAEDGDALDVLVLMDAPMPVGMLVSVKLIGVLTARQTQASKTLQNDRLIGVPCTEVNAPAFTRLSQVDGHVLDEIEHFFTSYNRAHGRTFKPGARLGSREAEGKVEAARVDRAE